MALTSLLLPFLAAVCAGALNAVAGGGSLLTFPALLVAGVSPIAANATSTVALWPGSIGSALGYRRELEAQGRQILGLIAVSLVGGGLGGWLLVKTPTRLFELVLPFLMLVATLA